MPRAFKSFSVSTAWNIIAAWLLSAVILLLHAGVAHAFGATECAASRKASDLVCTANDVSITGISVAPGGPTSCVGGSTINIDLDVTVNFSVPDRWDIGIFLVNDGKNPKLLPANGGASTCSVAVLPTTSPFLNLDPGPWGGVLDTCGDGNGSINGGTGSGVLRVTGVPVSCRALTSSGGKLYIPFVVTWDNQSSPSGSTCASNLDPLPNTTSKCNSPDVTVPTEVAYGTVDLVVLPTITKTDGIAVVTAGDTVDYSVVITNTTGDTLSGAVFKDPAVANLTANSVSCAASGGATCPASPTVGAMQGAGISIPDMPVNSSITFTINATVSASTPAGTLANTATVTVNGQTNSATDTDTVIRKLAASKSFAPASIAVGGTTILSISISNSNLNDAAGVAFTDTYPAGLVNAALPNTTNTCGGTVTASGGGNSVSLSGGTIPAGGSCTVTVDVTSSVVGSYNNSTGAITTTNGYTGDPATASLPVGQSNLSSSTKSWQDQNGGDQNPGDVIRYTLTLIETAGMTATGVSVTDTIPATLTGLTVVTCPAGATCGVAGQTLTASDITVPANGSASVVFDATIVSGTPSGTLIDNCATVSNTSGIGASPCAPTITVSASSISSSGNKPLYLYGAAGYELSRARPSGAPAAVTINKGGSRLWTQSPALASSVTVSTSSTNVPVRLYLGSNADFSSRTVRVDLVCSGGGTTFTQTQTLALNIAPALFTFNLPITANQTCVSGQTWNLTVTNNNSGGGQQDITVYPVSAGDYSYVNLPSQNIINVDSVNNYSAPYPSVSVPASGYYTSGETVYLRAVISDPFGSYDITSAAITITDANGSTVVNNAAMSMVADSGSLTKTYEYPYTVPVAGPTGYWNVTVNAVEGVEGTVSDNGTGSFQAVFFPSITMLKSLQTVSDPYNGTTNPKAIPGAFVLYSVTATNSGYGTGHSVNIDDPVPSNTKLFVGDLGAAGSGPVSFIDGAGAVSSGLSYSFINLPSIADSLEFSNNNGASYVYTPAPDSDGCDVNVTNVRANLGATFRASDGTNHPYFTLRFKVMVK